MMSIYDSREKLNEEKRNFNPKLDFNKLVKQLNWNLNEEVKAAVSKAADAMDK